ncbi:unnamed protein product [Cylicostephanus goldi]|uniref:Uncharacterized protein n=1 Tax=Cylicostephanus goldi TaxID=71465 RepID=A0A3P6SXD5_CYLGO|nr:unnamed protein product [Cylicostephanus goldi]
MTAEGGGHSDGRQQRRTMESRQHASPMENMLRVMQEQKRLQQEQMRLQQDGMKALLEAIARAQSAGTVRAVPH